MYQSRIRNQKAGRHFKRREFVDIEDGQHYAIVQDMLGNGRVNVFCDDKSVKIARIRGSLRKYSKKVLIEKGDLVLVSEREYGDDKVDLFHKYTSDDVSYLTRHALLPEVLMKKLQCGGDITIDEGKDGEDTNYVVFMNQVPEHSAVAEDDLNISAI